jgi:ankyrin repeat protein
MNLLDVARSDQIHPVGLLINERWKDDIRKPLPGLQHSLLSLAAQFGCMVLVEDLLEEGIDLSARNTINRTLIFYASEAGHYGVIQHLETGAIVRIHDTDDQTRLSLPAEPAHGL